MKICSSPKSSYKSGACRKPRACGGVRYWLGFLALAVALTATAEGDDVQLSRVLTPADDKGFADIGGVMLDRDGTVYLTDTDNGTLVRVDAATNAPTVLAGDSVFHSRRLTSVARLNEQLLAVANGGDHTIAVIDASGKLRYTIGESGSQEGQLKHPASVAVSPRNRLYVAESGNDRISVFTHDGIFLFSFGNRSAVGEANLNRPAQVAVDDEEHIFVLETRGRGRVSVYNAEGELLKRFTGEELKGQGDRETELAALAADGAGRLYLADKANGKILQLDWMAAKVVRTFGSRGESRGQFSKIAGIGVSPDHQLAIADRGNRKVEIYRLPDAAATAATAARFPGLQRGSVYPFECDKAYALPTSDFLCLSRERRSVNRVSREGKKVVEFSGPFRDPQAAAVDDKDVAIADGDKVSVFSHDGKRRFTIGRGGGRDGEFDDIGGLFLSDKLYVADSGNRRVQIFTRDGVFLDKLVNIKDQPSLLEKPVAVVVDSQRNVCVADNGLNRVRVFSPKKELLYELGGGASPDDRIEKIHALAVDRDDNLYVLLTTARNRYAVHIYNGPKRILSFGSYGEQGSGWTGPTSLTLLSSEKTAVGVYDSRRKAMLAYHFLQIPNRVGDLTIHGGLAETRLHWQKVPGHFVDRYNLYGAMNPEGPFEKIQEARGNTVKVPAEQAKSYVYYRVSAVSGFGIEGDPSQTRQDLFASGYRLYQAHMFEPAAELFDRARRESADHAEALEYLGRSKLELANVDVAVGYFQELARLPGQETRGLNLEASAQIQARQYLAARAVLERAIGKHLADAQTYLLCGQVSLQLGDAIGAAGCLESAIKLDNKNPASHFLLGQAYIKLGAVDKGLAEFDAAVKFSPDSSAALLRSAQAYQALNRHRDALERFKQVLSLDGTNAEARLGSAQCHIALKEYDKARSIALPMAGSPDQEGAGQYLLGVIALATHKPQDAVLSLVKAGRRDPQNAAVWLALADAYGQLKDDDKTRAALQQATVSAPEAFEPHWRLAQLQQKLGNHTDALAGFAKAVALQPDHYDAHYAYAVSLLATDRHTEAATQAREAARLSSRRLEPMTLLAEVAYRQGKNGEAIDYLKKAVAIKPDSAELHLKLGRSYLENNVYDQAQTHLDKAILLDATNDVPHGLLGQMYLERRLYDAAIKAFEKAAELGPSEANKLQLNAAYAEKKKSQEFRANAPRVVLEDLKLKRVFAAAYKQYATEPIGTVRLRNLGNTDHGNLKLSFYIKGYMDFADSRDLPLLKANSVLEVPLYAAFNDKVLSIEEDTRMQAEIKLVYIAGSQQDATDVTQSLTLYSKNAILWSNSNMVGSFVTPKEEALKGFVRQAVNQHVPDSGPLNKNLVQAMVMFNAMSAHGLKYQADPNSPYSKVSQDQVDYVQFPRETLRLKSGDCDDLSVLLAAGLENLAIETAFVEAPGHLFLMFNTGLNEKNRDLISLQDDLTVIRNGEVWVPLEATMIATSFSEAWAEGARKYREAETAKTLTIIPTKGAWAQFTPVTLAPAGYTIEVPAGERVRRLIEREYRILITKNLERLVLPYRAMLVNDPNDQEAHMQAGLVYAKNGLEDMAFKAFERVLEINPKNSAAHNNRGNLYYNLNDYDRALDAYRYAETLDPTDGGIKLNLALTFYKLGKITEAQSKFREATALQKGFVEQYRSFEKLLVN